MIMCMFNTSNTEYLTISLTKLTQLSFICNHLYSERVFIDIILQCFLCTIFFNIAQKCQSVRFNVDITKLLCRSTSFIEINNILINRTRVKLGIICTLILIPCTWWFFMTRCASLKLSLTYSNRISWSSNPLTHCVNIYYCTVCLHKQCNLSNYTGIFN